MIDESTDIAARIRFGGEESQPLSITTYRASPGKFEMLYIGNTGWSVQLNPNGTADSTFKPEMYIFPYEPKAQFHSFVFAAAVFGLWKFLQHNATPADLESLKSTKAITHPRMAEFIERLFKKSGETLITTRTEPENDDVIISMDLAKLVKLKENNQLIMHCRWASEKVKNSSIMVPTNPQ